MARPSKLTKPVPTSSRVPGSGTGDTSGRGAPNVNPFQNSGLVPVHERVVTGPWNRMTPSPSCPVNMVPLWVNVLVPPPKADEGPTCKIVNEELNI